MLLEFSDIAHLIPTIEEKIRERVEQDIFITYPEGLARRMNYNYEILNDKEKRNAKDRARKLWQQRKFPRTEKEGIRGVWLNELKRYLNE
jgi:hypothetical protein